MKVFHLNIMAFLCFCLWRIYVCDAIEGRNRSGKWGIVLTVHKHASFVVGGI